MAEKPQFIRKGGKVIPIGGKKGSKDEAKSKPKGKSLQAI